MFLHFKLRKNLSLQNYGHKGEGLVYSKCFYTSVHKTHLKKKTPTELRLNSEYDVKVTDVRKLEGLECQVTLPKTDQISAKCTTGGIFLKNT